MYSERFKLIFERGERPLLAAVADHPGPLRRHDDVERLVGVGRFDRTRGEEQPAIVGPAQARARRRREAGLGKDVGEIGADRRRFGDDRLAVSQRRHLAHRVDRQILGRLHRSGDIREFRLCKVGRLPPASIARCGRATSDGCREPVRPPLVDLPSHSRPKARSLRFASAITRLSKKSPSSRHPPDQSCASKPTSSSISRTSSSAPSARRSTPAAPSTSTAPSASCTPARSGRAFRSSPPTWT